MWFQSQDEESNHLEALLNYAHCQYGRHTEWFLRHRDIGISTLATILTAQSALGGLLFSDKLAPIVAIATILILMLLVYPLMELSRYACKQAFRAAMEHTALIAKIVWSMGLAECVSVKRTATPAGAPFELDQSFYIPRYIRGAKDFPTTDAYVNHHLKHSRNSYRAARLTLLTMGCSAWVLGTGILAGFVYRMHGR
jgi:hypothetical protein